MNIEILQEQLTSGLTSVLRAVSSRAQLPVLSHVLLEATAEGIILSATDLELGIRVKIPAKVSEPGATTVPAKMFFEFLSSLSPGKVLLSSAEGALVVSSGSYSATFQTLSVEEFPALPVFTKEIAVATIKLSDLSRSADRVTFASAKDSLRPALTGVLLETGKELTCVATDGFRLAVQKIPVTSGKGFATPLLVPARAIGEVARTAFPESIDVGYIAESHQLLFFSPETMVVTQLLDGNFPDYGKILPKEFTTELLLSRGELLQAVKAAHIFARDNSNMMRWKVEGKELVVSAHSPERGECIVRVPTEITGEEGEIVFNTKYVLDYLGVTESDELWFGMKGSLAPGMFRDGKSDAGMYVVMPINA